MDYGYNNYLFSAEQQFYPNGALPPSPPNSNGMGADGMNQASSQDPFAPPKFDQFQAFDAFASYNSHGMVGTPPTPHSQHNPSVGSMSLNGTAGQSPMSMTMEEPIMHQGVNKGSNSDDEDATPAQSRRKAQNRAAQRAFRERKERHVKELEAQVAALESARTAAATENETLKASLHRAKTENEILKATTAPISHAYSSSISHTGPMGYTPRDQSSFYSNVLKGHDNKEPSHRIVKDETGGRLLAAAAAWDFIMEDERVKEGRVDVVRVSEYLRNRARCDGMGPVFAEGEILAAIEECTGMDSDTL